MRREFGVVLGGGGGGRREMARRVWPTHTREREVRDKCTYTRPHGIYFSLQHHESVVSPGGISATWEMSVRCACWSRESRAGGNGEVNNKGRCLGGSGKWCARTSCSPPPPPPQSWDPHIPPYLPLPPTPNHALLWLSTQKMDLESSDTIW